MSGTFNVKLAPKLKQQTDFPLFIEWVQIDLKLYNNRTVYMNHNNAGIHIYNPYFIKDAMASPMKYIRDNDYHTPYLTLNELNKEDIIVFWTQEDVNKYKAGKSKTSKP